MISTTPNETTLIQTLFEMSGITSEKVNEMLIAIANDAAKPLILFWDVNDIMKATTFSRKFLEDHILSDPRIQRYERQREKGGKRVWLKEPTSKILQEIIMNEWY
ncbi:hypothetical protein LAV73_13890 [Lysinibacillus xylanilyticus]|uniref:hypothetical protein n=1 Tax=Lysinibacillus xylanilyticus TaxID=582475 RepID=UPI002B25038A|nr:hypothetical protein [Lysinibacillus xylanilyticus]MEB2281079.1 hypothetical protein [Lysinibacillus xylanilyticus]